MGWFNNGYYHKPNPSDLLAMTWDDLEFTVFPWCFHRHMASHRKTNVLPGPEDEQCNQCAYRMSRCDFNRDRGDIVWGQPGLTWMEYGSTDQDWRIRISLATIERSREAIVQSLSMSQVLIKAKTLQRSLCLDN